MNDPTNAPPERRNTDESLRVERSSSDTEIAKHLSDADAAADDILMRARENADAVLEAARGKADEKLDPHDTHATSNASLDRAQEDELLEEERGAADEVLRQQREERANTIAALFPLEREKTDRNLLTERARSDAALVTRADFLGIVTHDIGNLLSGIFVNASVLAEKASDSEEGRRTVAATQSIHRYVARVNRLIRDLVDVASIDAGTFGMRLRRRDAVALVRNAAATFEQAAKAKGIQLSFSAAEPELLADLDADRVTQVLANLITNALHFTGHGGTVIVRVEREASGEGSQSDKLRFTVIDTGSGIDAAKLEAVFQRFWQLGQGNQRGFGLGLYLSRCIVAAHGGRIWVESTLGAGSAFHITIPVLAASSSPPAPSDPSR